VLAGGLLVRRFLAPLVERVAERVLQAAVIAAVVALAIVLTFIQRDGLVDALQRWGVVLVVPAIAGIVLLAWKPERYLDHLSALFVVALVATFTVLFAHRLPTARSAPYYLYWDRYLFSEVLPLALIFVAIGFDGVLDLLTARALALRIAAGAAI